MSAPRLPNLPTSYRRLFQLEARSRSKSNEGAFRRVHRLSKRNFPNGVPVPGDPATDERIARAIAADALFALTTYEGRVAPDWYSRSISDMITLVSAAHPELSDEMQARRLSGIGISSCADARCVMMAAVAITSQGVGVRTNARSGLDQYRHFLENGRFDPVSIGPSGQSIYENLQRFNDIVDLSGNDASRIRNLFDASFTVREFQEIAERNGISLALKERLDETVNGSLILGPKIGSFYQNLIGNESSLTIDMWLMRTWGRITGTLMNDEVPTEGRDRLTRALAHSSGESRTIWSSYVSTEVDPETLLDGDVEKVASTSAKLVRAWEKFRRHAIADGRTQADMNVLKAEWEWPHAAQALMSSTAKTNDQPRSAGMRSWIRSVVSRSAEIVEAHGYPVTISCLQAILWYPEKQLAANLAGRSDPAINISFDEAFFDLLVEEGFEPEALRGLVDRFDSETSPESLAETEFDPPMMKVG